MLSKTSFHPKLRLKRQHLLQEQDTHCADDDCVQTIVRDAMRVRELRGDEFIAEKRRNDNVEQTRERMRGDIQRDCGLRVTSKGIVGCAK